MYRSNALHKKPVTASGVERSVSVSEPRASKAVDSSQAALASDMVIPSWGLSLTALFTVLASLSALSVTVLAVFFFSDVAIGGEALLAPLLFLGGIVPVLGSYALHHANILAFPGWRLAREARQRQIEAATAGCVVLALAVVHPLCLVPFAITGGIAWGGLALLARRGAAEPLWDFNIPEAAALLAGRNRIGFDMAADPPSEQAGANGLQRVATWMGVLAMLAISSWLVAHDVLGPSAMVSLPLIAFWTGDGLTRYLRDRARPAQPVAYHPAIVTDTTDDADEDIIANGGLVVRGLSVETADGDRLLSDINFDVQPGSMTGIIGDTGAGKSILLRALADPYSLVGLRVNGHVSVNRIPIWERSTGPHAPPIVYLPEHPLILPGHGLGNLTAWQDGMQADRADRILENFVFSTESLAAIRSAPDATLLPGMQQRAMVLSRAFMMSPQVYLLDLPETGLPERQVGILVDKLKQELRLGRSVLVVSDNRAILETCDRLVALEVSRIVDNGDANEMRKRISVGWQRFVGDRRLETDDMLQSWLKAQFKRDGDEGNQRAVCRVGAELLAFSCQGGGTTQHGSFRIEVKKFRGRLRVKFSDTGPVPTAAQFQIAEQKAAAAVPGERLLPLPALHKSSRNLRIVEDGPDRVITLEIPIYDPRLGETEPVEIEDESMDA